MLLKHPIYFGCWISSKKSKTACFSYNTVQLKIKLLFLFTIWCWYLNLQNVILFWWQHCCFTKIGQSAWPTLDIYGTQCFKGTEDIKTYNIQAKRTYPISIFCKFDNSRCNTNIATISCVNQIKVNINKKSWVSQYILLSLRLWVCPASVSLDQISSPLLIRSGKSGVFTINNRFHNNRLINSTIVFNMFPNCH